MLDGFFNWLRSLLDGIKLWVVVSPWELAVRVRCGKFTKTLQPGWHWRIPVLDEVILINTRLRLMNVPCQTITTRDGKTLTVSAMIGFCITDPETALKEFHAPADSCAALAMGEISKFIGEKTLAEIDKSEMEAAICAELVGTVKGIEFRHVHIIDFAAVKTIRLMQESWRPNALPELDTKPGTTSY